MSYAAQLEQEATEKVLTLRGMWRISEASGQPVDPVRQRALIVGAITRMRLARIDRDGLALAAGAREAA